MERNKNVEAGQKSTTTPGHTENEIVIPIVEEHITVDKEVVETSKINITTKIVEDEAMVNLPVLSERYEVRHIPVDKVFVTPPPVRYEGDVLVVPVIEEIVVVEKRYKVVEEVHLIKHTTETPFTQQVTLKKQQVNVERTDSNGEKTSL